MKGEYGTAASLTITESFEQSATAVAGENGLHLPGDRILLPLTPRNVATFRRSLHRLGIRSGHKVILYAPNSSQWVVAWLGIQRLGAVVVPITPIYTPMIWNTSPMTSGAQAVVCTDRNFGYVHRVKPESQIEHVLRDHDRGSHAMVQAGLWAAFDKVPKGKVSWEDGHLLPFRQMAGRGKRASIFRTSNPTTSWKYSIRAAPLSMPRACRSPTRCYMIASLEQLAMCEGLFPKEENVIMCAAPLFHILGQSAAWERSWWAEPSSWPPR